MSRGVVLTLAGLAGGVLLAVIATPLMTPLLYGVRPDYVKLVAVTAGVLLMVAALACFAPARRASRIDPMIALRNE
jgi:putative ABC transport system permease protein